MLKLNKYRASLRFRFALYISGIVAGAIIIMAIFLFWVVRSTLYVGLELKGNDYAKALSQNSQYHLFTGDPFGDLADTRDQFQNYSDMAYIIFQTGSKMVRKSMKVISSSCTMRSQHRIIPLTVPIWPCVTSPVSKAMCFLERM